MLIKSYQKRQAQRLRKQSDLLRFLRDETWSVAEVIAAILGCSRPAAYKTLNQLAKRGLITSYLVPELRLTLWGITPTGLAFAWSDKEQMTARPYFEPSRVSVTGIYHHIAVQKARQRYSAAGWSNWTPGTQLPLRAPKRPDAIVVSPRGDRVAIELERHIKTLKRYEAIWAGYLRLIKQGEYHSVHYVCPDDQLAPRLSRVFGLIESVPFAGERVSLQDRHRSKFRVLALSDAPG